MADEPAGLGHLPQAKFQVALVAERSGFVSEVDAMGVALAALRLGAGRARAEDAVDHAVGVSGLVKVGERVEAGAPLCVIHANDEQALGAARAQLAEAIRLGETPVTGPALIDELVS